MNWHNLQENKCPKCGSDIAFGGNYGDELTCVNYSCDFKITARRMEEIVMDMNNQDLKNLNK